MPYMIAVSLEMSDEPCFIRGNDLDCPEGTVCFLITSLSIKQK